MNSKCSVSVGLGITSLFLWRFRCRCYPHCLSALLGTTSVRFACLIPCSQSLKAAKQQLTQLKLILKGIPVPKFTVDQFVRQIFGQKLINCSQAETVMRSYKLHVTSPPGNLRMSKPYLSFAKQPQRFHVFKMGSCLFVLVLIRKSQKKT